MIFDTHAHYYDAQFDEDREALLSSMQAKGVGTIVNVGASLVSCPKVVKMAEQYPFMYASVGIHPDHAGSLNEENFEELKKLYDHEKVIAVGEIGLDYYWDKASHEVQKEWFIRQIEFARERNLPIIVHSREAAQDTFDIMKEHAQGLKGVVHCYSYSREMAKEYVKMGFYIGVGGVLTFTNGKKLRKVVEDLPLEAIVLETDCPYLAPAPFRGKRNDSSLIKYVAETVAKIKDVTYEEVVTQTEKNAKEMYNLL